MPKPQIVTLAPWICQAITPSQSPKVGPATRTCSIPSGKAILLPLINAQCNYLTKPNLKTNSQLLDCAIVEL